MRKTALILSFGFALGLGANSHAAMDKTPFDTFAAEIAAEGKTGKSHLSLKGLSSQDMTAFSARMQAAHGAPKSGRGALKVWEIKNPMPKAGDADFITVMLGPNKHGQNALIFDCRGVPVYTEATRARAQAQQSAQSRRDNARANAAARTHNSQKSMPRTRSAQSRAVPMRSVLNRPAISEID